jgi:intracellular septation protein A
MIKGKTNGLKSSEFLLTIAGLICGALAAVFADSEWVKICGPIAAAVLGASYNHSRGMVKKALTGAEAVKAVGKQKD